MFLYILDQQQVLLHHPDKQENKEDTTFKCIQIGRCHFYSKCTVLIPTLFKSIFKYSIKMQIVHIHVAFSLRVFKMAVAAASSSEAFYSVSSYIKGHHVYIRVWSPVIGDC